MSADIEQYKFLVEKRENGLSVDIQFKATIKGGEEETKNMPTSGTGSTSRNWNP